MGPDAPTEKYLVCNADEMEPGTFKDRLLMEHLPHQLIEAMIVVGYAIQAKHGYIFLRGEYIVANERLNNALAQARAAGYLGENILGSGWSFDLNVHSGAGRYICGEETALINSLEGRRANPRSKPPFPQIAGLWGKPTIINNVETLCNIPHIVLRGADWFKGLSQGKSTDSGTKLYGVSGRAKRTGVWELPIGTTAREILYEHAGGMADGYELKLAAGRRVHRLPDARASRPGDGLRHHHESRQSHGHRSADGGRRQAEHYFGSAQSRAVLCARIVRLVHSVPRRPAMDREDPAGDRARRRPPRRHRNAAADHAPARPGQNVLRACAGRDGTAAERVEIFQAGIRERYRR
jgi:hypothetical protein